MSVVIVNGFCKD